MNIESNKVSITNESPQLSGIICYKHFSNRVHHCDFLQNDLPDKSVNLIIADFSYFEVKGEFDFIWKSFEEFLAWVELCAKEFKRLLKDNGTLFVYGHAKKIAYKQVIFDKYFNLENSIVWRKTDCQTRKGYENYRCFAPVTERILMYSNETNKTGLEIIFSDANCFIDLKNYMDTEKIKANLSNKQINEIIGSSTNGGGLACHYFGFTKDLTKTQFQIPIKEHYEKMQKTGFFTKPYEQLRQEYEQLRQEYEQLRRPFNNYLRMEDVWDYAQDVQETKEYDHPTKKTEKLSRTMILTCSKPDDLVLVPFVGSGTECAMAKKEKRNFVGFDINPKYVEMSNKRCDAIQSGLF